MNFFLRSSCLAIVSCLWVSLPLSAFAGPFEDGVIAYNTKDYGQALEHWRVSADVGHGESQFNLGYMFENGQGVEISLEHAVFWYAKAVQNGYADAKTRLNSLNSDVLVGVPKTGDVEGTTPEHEPERITPMPKAQEWMSLEEWVSQTDDINETVNTNTAEPIFDVQAKNIEKPISKEELARMYLTGTGVEKSNERAINLYEEAANNGSLSAQNQLAVLFTYGMYGVEKSQQKSAHWYAMAAAQGDASAMYTTGVNYHEGRGVEPSTQIAAGWFEKAAQTGYEAAKIRLKTINSKTSEGK